MIRTQLGDVGDAGDSLRSRLLHKMPASRLGLRSASDWKTHAKVNAPASAIHQAMIAPNGPVAFAKMCGSENMPAPIIDQTTMEVRAANPAKVTLCGATGSK